MNHLLSLVRRWLLFTAIAGIASLILPQIGVVIARNPSYETALNSSWDAAAAASGLLAFGALEMYWGSWLCFTVPGGMVDNNLVKGSVSLVTGVTLIAVAVVVLTTLVLP
ncbi:hypothetical protein [Streptomyces sp. NBC_01233]|uniref:hypothetical protein n=1 Tax=Streptomyces sp. NBC_01233 TaxID=2903787 RepID=UPI002E156081|nr:hypothetical protein OG332_23595 [Streptomyces sp. NBC_01233]